MSDYEVKWERRNRFNLKSLSDNAKIHFIALGGIGMSALARILQKAGYRISGSDLTKNHLMEYFEGQGAEVYVGHSADNIAGCDVVVKSSAIKDDNPELVKAQDSGVRVIHRAELLNAMLRDMDKFAIGVTGTHGKTTTTGMITTILQKSGHDPSYAIGGEIPALKTNSDYGDGKYFVAELDESDGSIELYAPNITVVTNLEHDHADYYKDGMAQLLETMHRFSGALPENAKIVINIDNEGNRTFIKQYNCRPENFCPRVIITDSGQTKHIAQCHERFVTFAIDNRLVADYSAEITETAPNASFKAYRKAEYLGEINLKIPGTHNVYNALAAIAACMEAGIDFKAISKALSDFTGMKKRFQTIGYAKGARIVDDYAHHPTEISATVDTARKIVDMAGKGRVIVVFQPHRYTRFSCFWNEFLKSFDKAHKMYVCDVYSAGDKPIEGISSEKFASQLKSVDAQYVKGAMQDVAQEVVKDIAEGDIVLTMGAGDITKLGGIIIELAGK